MINKTKFLSQIFKIDKKKSEKSGLPQVNHEHLSVKKRLPAKRKKIKKGQQKHIF